MPGSNSGRQSANLATCPACGGERPFEREHHDDQPERVPQLIIVADDRAHLYELFQRAFAYSETVQVLVDRRVAERRRRSGSSATDRRRGDRRAPMTADGLLRSMGWTITPPGCPGAVSGFCPLILSRAASGSSLLTVAGSSSDARPLFNRHLLGVGVLLLTIVPGYVASRMTSAHATAHVMHARNGQQPASERAARSEAGKADIQLVAARSGVSAALTPATIAPTSASTP